MEKLLFLFLDGVGVGPEDTTTNPFAAARTPFLETLIGGKLTSARSAHEGPGFVFRTLDATLGHAGLPQSATGQASLLTGINGADVMNGHYGPWPGPTLKQILEADTLFHLASEGGAVLANAYPDGYFEALKAGRLRVNVPAYAARAAGLPLADLTAYRAGGAVAADLTGRYLRKLVPDVPERSPAEAGALLSKLAAQHRFTFFDLWLTDSIGHRGAFAEAVDFIEHLDGFLEGSAASPEVTVLVTSDHGNLEDMASRSHSRAPVPMLALGPNAGTFAGATSLLDIAPAAKAMWGAR